MTVAHQQVACQASPLPITRGSQICVVRAKARRRSQGQLHMLMNRCQAHIMQVLCIPSHVAGGVSACMALTCMILPCMILTCARPSSPVSISSDGVVRHLAYPIGVGSASRADLRAWPRQIDADRRTMYPALQFSAPCNIAPCLPWRLSLRVWRAHRCVSTRREKQRVG